MATEKLLGQPPRLVASASSLSALDTIFGADAEIMRLAKEDVILRDETYVAPHLARMMTYVGAIALSRDTLYRIANHAIGA